MSDLGSLAELFARDPLSLSDREVDEIIAGLRKQRENFIKEETKSKSSGKRTRAKTVSQVQASALTLDDLGL